MNLVVFTGIVIELFKISILDPRVWAIPVCLSTLTILSEGKTFNTFNSSVSLVFPEPTLIEPPIDTEPGISVNIISWTRPAELPTVILDARLTLLVETPTLNIFVKFLIFVLKPDIDTASWSFNSMNGK